MQCDTRQRTLLMRSESMWNLLLGFAGPTSRAAWIRAMTSWKQASSVAASRGGPISTLCDAIDSTSFAGVCVAKSDRVSPFADSRSEHARSSGSASFGYTVQIVNMATANVQWNNAGYYTTCIPSRTISIWDFLSFSNLSNA